MNAPAPVARPPQFSLQHLLVVTSIVAVWLGVLAAGGTEFLVWMIPFLIVPLLLDGWWFGRNPRFALGYSVAGTIVGFLVLVPQLPSGRDGYSGVCGNNLRQIHVALRSYHYQYGSFPPIATSSESGRPMHSWRTLILPHIEREDLREAYDFSEPWDGPTNKQLHDQRINIFRCPSERNNSARDVTYLAVVDPAAKPGDRFAVIEIPNSGVNFFEPRDITLAELQAGQSPDGKPIRPLHSDQTRLHLAMPDGTVLRVTLKELPQKLKSLKAGE